MSLKRPEDSWQQKKMNQQSIQQVTRLSSWLHWQIGTIPFSISLRDKSGPTVKMIPASSIFSYAMESEFCGERKSTSVTNDNPVTPTEAAVVCLSLQKVCKRRFSLLPGIIFGIHTFKTSERKLFLRGKKRTLQISQKWYYGCPIPSLSLAGQKATNSSVHTFQLWGVPLPAETEERLQDSFGQTLKSADFIHCLHFALRASAHHCYKIPFSPIHVPSILTPF